MDIVIYGAGKFGKYFTKYYSHKADENIVAIIDSKSAGNDFCGYMVRDPQEIKKVTFDLIIVTTIKDEFIEEILNTLDLMRVPKAKIKVAKNDKGLLFEVISNTSLYDESDIRVNWIKEYAYYCEQSGLDGCIAECGVDKGDLAYYLNTYFEQKRLLLFDSFSGFSKNDIETERNLGNDAFARGSFNKEGGFVETSENLVLAKMPHKEKVIIKKGYIPDTLDGIEEHFCFVNLDMDLYKPTLEALKFFYPRMCQGGIILCHDYFHPELPGIKAAFDEFEKVSDTRLRLFPIGDDCSIALIR